MSDYIPLIYSDTDSNTLHRGRVSLAHEILSGIPQELIQLDHFYAPGQSWLTGHCNTIACGAGWLALHPEFRSFGLHPWLQEWERTGVEFRTYPPGGPVDLKGFEALAAVFVLDVGGRGPELMRNMFSERRYGAWDHVLLKILGEDSNAHATDRNLLLMRLRYAYQHHCGRAPV